MICCKNDCEKPSIWAKGNAYSACEDHKEELQKMLEGYHLHSQCDNCGAEFCHDKVCNVQGDHKFDCFACQFIEEKRRRN